MDVTQRVRIAGIACTVGGLLWTLVLVGFGAFGLTTPATPVAFYIFQALFVLIQILLLIGVLGLGWSGAAGHGWFAAIALGIALLGRALFVLAEVHLLLSFSDFSPLLPLGALTTALGMLLTGLAVLRARRWRGWARFAPLLAGLYPFLTMFPVLAITGDVSNVLIGLWGLPWALLGVALTQHAHLPQPTLASTTT
jgi:hypothetical protein